MCIVNSAAQINLNRIEYLNPVSLVLQLNLLSSWGDPHYVGLTGLEVVGKGGEGVPVDVSMITASPCDLNDLPEYSNDLRTLDKSVIDTLCISELRWGF